jgi:AcrR family transcriptional regulator
MSARDRWIDEGMAVLREQGAAGVRVDRIAARLGLTKGSFHHHFRGADDYRRALLHRYESDTTAAIEAAVTAVAGLDAERAVMALPAHADVDPDLDGAVRGWAVEDDEARAVLQRVDAARLDALVRLWRQVLPDRRRARTAALVPHLVMIGASMARPTPTDRELRDVFALLATLVPSVR